MPAFTQSHSYTPATLERAERSLRCSPFKIDLFETMRSQRVSMGEITGNNGIKNNYTKRTLSELSADNALVWLIEVGILRREVDGQGITDSFRLTPLGHHLVMQEKVLPTPTWGDRISNFATRFLRVPF